MGRPADMFFPAILIRLEIFDYFSIMRFAPVALVLLFVAGAAVPAFAQRDAQTSSARAAYSTPSGNWHSSSKKGKNKKVKARKAKKAKKAKKANSDADRQKRRSLQHF